MVPVYEHPSDTVRTLKAWETYRDIYSRTRRRTWTLRDIILIYSLILAVVNYAVLIYERTKKKKTRVRDSKHVKSDSPIFTCYVRRQ